MKRFTADLHFDMPKFLGRPFPDMASHDEAILDAVNSGLNKRDTLYLLGDVCMSPRWPHFRNKIKCSTVILIRGNHDRPAFDSGVSRAEDSLETKILGVSGFLSHYPHAFWKGSHRQAIHLYGHCHAQREETLDAILPGRRSMDVGMDNAKRLFGFYKTFTDSEIIEILGNKPGHDHVDFYKGSYK